MVREKISIEVSVLRGETLENMRRENGTVNDQFMRRAPQRGSSIKQLYLN